MSGQSFITDSTPAGDFETITVSTTAIGFTASKLLINQAGGFHKRAVKAFLSIADGDIRVRFDGTNPTNTVGHKFLSGSDFTVIGDSDITKLRMIKDTASGADAAVSVTFYYVV